MMLTAYSCVYWPFTSYFVNVLFKYFARFIRLFIFIYPRYQSFIRYIVNIFSYYVVYGLPWQLGGKEPICNAATSEDMGSFYGLGRSPGEGSGNPLQYSHLENPMDRGAWQAAVHRVANSQTWLKWLNMHIHRQLICFFLIVSFGKKKMFLILMKFSLSIFKLYDYCSLCPI